MFQFHKGSINTLRGFNYGHCSKLFQVHKGSINTDVKAMTGNVFPGFNSIKVQLILCR